MRVLLGVAFDALRAMRRCTVAALICLAPMALGACSTLQSLEGPPPAFDMDKDIADLQQHYGSATSIKDYYSQPETVERRNEFITGRLTLINLQYLKFIEQLPLTDATFNTAVEITRLGLDIAGTATGSAGAKTVLAAIAAGVSGSKLSIDRNFLDEKTIGALVSVMNAQRKAALIPILQGIETKNVGDYPLAKAIVDLDNYYYSGTLPGALNAVQADAATKDAAAQKTIDSLRSVAFGSDSNSTRLVNWLFPGATGRDAKGTPVDGSGNAVAISKANLITLNDWLNRNDLQGLSVMTLVFGAATSQMRAQAVTDLKIP